MSSSVAPDESLSLMEALMNYRQQPLYRRLRKFGKRESMLHPDVLQLIYHFARSTRGAILEIGSFRGGSIIAAALGVRDSGKARKIITIEAGGPLRRHPLATRDIVGTLQRNLRRQRFADTVTVLQGWSSDAHVITAVHEQLGPENVELLIIDADGKVKRDLAAFGSNLADGCRIVIDDYAGPAPKGAPTKMEVDELVAAGRLVPLGYYGHATWIGKWRATPLPAQ